MEQVRTPRHCRRTSASAVGWSRLAGSDGERSLFPVREMAEEDQLTAFLNGAGLSTLISQRVWGAGRLRSGSVERGWGQHAAPAAKRGRTVLRPSEGGAHFRAAASCRALVASMKLWPASVSMSRSTTARGCQAFLRADAGRMKPWDVSLWWSGGRGANHLLDRTVVGHAATRPARRFSFHAAAAAAAARAVARHRASPSRRT